MFTVNVYSSWERNGLDNGLNYYIKKGNKIQLFDTKK